MSKLNILFAGCGFLCSHLIFHFIPHSNHLILLDREKIEKVNYDNSIFPKNYIGRRKVTGLTSLIQLVSSIQTTPIHLSLKSTRQFAEICDNFNVDLIIVTFDNAKSRLIAKKYSLLSGKPMLFIGVTEEFVYIDWAEDLILPETSEEKQKVSAELIRIRDVCTRLEFRVLGVIAAGYAYHVFRRWNDYGEKHMYNISIRDVIRSTNLKRD